MHICLRTKKHFFFRTKKLLLSIITFNQNSTVVYMQSANVENIIKDNVFLMYIYTHFSSTFMKWFFKTLVYMDNLNLSKKEWKLCSYLIYVLFLLIRQTRNDLVFKYGRGFPMNSRHVMIWCLSMFAGFQWIRHTIYKSFLLIVSP